jgi:hypothetical protein
VSIAAVSSATARVPNFATGHTPLGPKVVCTRPLPVVITISRLNHSAEVAGATLL